MINSKLSKEDKQTPDNLIWLRRQIIPQSMAFVNILSPMAQFGLNVFEGVRCYWSSTESELYAFRLDEHLARLMQSCRIVGMVAPYSIEEIKGFVKEVVAANNFQCDIAIRLTIFVDGIGTWSSSEPTEMFVAPIAKARTSLDCVPAFKASVSSWQRVSDNVLPPRAKVGANYINGRYAHLQAKYDGYDLPIFLGSDGKVSEGAGACLFMVRDGMLVTPSTSSSILEGITRDTIIRLAADMGVKVVERVIDRTELYTADEIFLCGSAAEISPIVSVDRFGIGDLKPGLLTVNLLKQYLAITSGIDNRYPEWRMVVNQA